MERGRERIKDRRGSEDGGKGGRGGGGDGAKVRWAYERYSRNEASAERRPACSMALSDLRLCSSVVCT
jgi:hypothetical protein